MHDELVKALRICAEASREMGCAECTVDKTADVDCVGKLMRDAADAIERLQVENNALRSENETYHKLVLLSVGEINELRYNLHLDEMDIEEIKLP